jgi:hypothetical protein
MDKKQIIDAYCRIRTIDNTISDDVLDFMKDASLERLKQNKPSPEQIFKKHAETYMVQYDHEGFKRRFRTLYQAIIESIKEASND